jgi:hypothetical protein
LLDANNSTPKVPAFIAVLSALLTLKLSEVALLVPGTNSYISPSPFTPVIMAMAGLDENIFAGTETETVCELPAALLARDTV